MIFSCSVFSPLVKGSDILLSLLIDGCGGEVAGLFVFCILNCCDVLRFIPLSLLVVFIILTSLFTLILGEECLLCL